MAQPDRIKRTAEQDAFISRLLMELPKVFGANGANHDEMISAIAGYLAWEMEDYTDANFDATLEFLVEEVAETRKMMRAIRAQGMH
jgi:hypothetical protein